METEYSPAEISLPVVRHLIETHNRTARADDVELYAHQFLTYCEAAQNIIQNGTICLHPRTGQPMQNPYVRVRSDAAAAMNKINRLLNLDPLWQQARRFLECVEREHAAAQAAELAEEAAAAAPAPAPEPPAPEPARKSKPKTKRKPR